MLPGNLPTDPDTPSAVDSKIQILELIDNDVHLVLQNQFAEVVAAAPTYSERKEYYAENPSHHARDVAMLAKVEQGCKDAGHGHVTNNLTVNINNLSFAQKQKLLEEERKILEKYANQYQYQNNKQVSGDDEVPAEKGRNRLENS